MDRNLQRQVASMRKSLFDQGYLDEQFIQLEDLQDDANPNFVEEIVTLFYTDSAKLIRNIDNALIGAKKVKTECTQFREYCNAGNAEGCIRTFQQVKQELATLKRKLETYFEIARQAGT
ncbi:pseudo histidine-containing phosphotransfer protein 5-like isoform X2 [Rhododendron vialii]|uniref:pseudo histidine-containing phosphotransfer protein 5-like isoform X2 n=1 Tax=Rhododendron vialii TaxID=182163 RepID=UPI00265DA97D|nr:pseudo histidine-containing phosphotransfer protein 5-like isoform X2 [Rhododendron vialii]